MISENLIKRAAEGDMEALVALDEKGLSPAPGEDAATFASRLNTLNENIRGMEAELNRKGSYTVEDVTVSKDARIPRAIFNEAAAKTGRLYGFQCDWVPGFFLNPKFSGLFGGCAFYFYPDFFALFIIRHSFRKQKKWLWYRRDELLAHELCHVARAGIASNDFEELFAYQTASTAFRRITGGIFRSQADVFLFLGVTLLQLLAQIARVFYFPNLPAWPAWTLLGAVFAFLVLRLCRDTAHHRRAISNLKTFCGDENDARIILFHCTDAEVRQLAKTKNVASLVENFADNQLRWKILLHRFPGNHGEKGADGGNGR